MKRLIFAFICLVGCAGVASAACTQEELLAKAQAFSANVQQVSQKDPAKYQEAMTAMQKDLPALQQNSADTSKLCEFYDTWNAKLK
jgi:hypothetical protein